ncbi:MAG TPA: adenylate/guanylate cyclase domain-containing protein [Actinomycetota bacterium]|jgi:class 3 adenylate cyclase|nr:adenylate/guanylate cyclase domain-containing protein [Actinomycetota bacterium]
MTTRRVVVDHVLFVVRDLQACRRLYTAALEPLGYAELRVVEDGVHYGTDGIDDFAVYEGAPITTGAHVAFDAPDRESVDAFFERAIASGASQRGRPGRWDQYSDRYYAAYVTDLHGNNVEAVWHATAPVEDAPRRVLTTILSTDIVGSTQHVARIGDREWVAVLQRHHAIVRDEIERHGGTEIDNAGDGFLVSFDGAARATRCALAVAVGVRELGIEIRAGVHTGEAEQIGDKLAGIAVHVAARLTTQAEPGEVIVSEPVRDLVEGSTFAFAEVGERRLKGVPGTWRLYRVET